MISRQRSGEWLRRLADRIDHDGAPKVTNWTFTFELGNGLVFRQDGRGCPVAYLGDDEFEKAHSGAVYPAPRSWDWAWLTSEDAQAAVRLMAVEQPWRPLPGTVVFAADMTDAPIRARP